MRHFLCLLCLILIGTAQSCSHAYYAPNLMDTPYLTKAKDGSASMALITGLGHTGFEFQGAWSPIKYGAVMLNGFQYNRTGLQNLTEGNRDRIRMLEAGIGAYTPAKPGGVCSLFMGIGLGNVRSQYIDPNSYYYPIYPYPDPGGYYTTAFSDIRTARFFIQPGYTVQNELFEVAVAARLIGVGFPSGDVDYKLNSTYDGKAQLDVIRGIEKNTPFFFPEIGGRFAVRFSPFTFGISGVLVPKANSNLKMDNSTVAATLTFNFQESGRRKKSQSGQ